MPATDPTQRPLKGQPIKCNYCGLVFDIFNGTTPTPSVHCWTHTDAEWRTWGDANGYAGKDVPRISYVDTSIVPPTPPTWLPTSA